MSPDPREVTIAMTAEEARLCIRAINADAERLDLEDIDEPYIVTLRLEAALENPGEPSLEDLFTALTQTGHSAEIGFNSEGRLTDPAGWWCYLREGLNGREVFEGFDSLRGALTAALTWTQEQP